MRTWVVLLLLLGLAPPRVPAVEHHGEVMCHGVPVPGATVVALRSGQKLLASTDEKGRYLFPDLAEGVWQLEVSMFGFAPSKREISVAAEAQPVSWELTILSLEEIQATPYTLPANNVPAATAKADATATQKLPEKAGASAAGRKLPEGKAPDASQSPADDSSHLADDGLLIRGSVNNSADSTFAQSTAFGNVRKGRWPYYSTLGVTFANSALDAQPFSLTGESAAKPSYNRVTGYASLGGQLRWKHLFRQSPNFFVSYQWRRSSDVNTQAALVPTATERNGIFSQPIVDPTSTTGSAFADNTIPAERISVQAKALLKYYPLPESSTSIGYNYQAALLNSSHQDSF